MPAATTNEVTLCRNCLDYNDDPVLKRHGTGWRHVFNNSVRCPGQADDKTDDRAIPATMTVEEAARELIDRFFLDRDEALATVGSTRR